MKQFLSVLALAVSFALPLRAATGLSGLIVTNLANTDFTIDLSGAPTNIIHVNVDPTQFTRNPRIRLTNINNITGSTIWTNDAGNYRPLQTQSSLTATGVVSAVALTAPDAFRTGLTTEVLVPGANCISVGNRTTIRLNTSGLSADPTAATLSLGTGITGNWLVLIRYQGSGNAFTMTAGAPVCDAGGGHVFLPSGNWTPLLQGESMLLWSDGNNWYPQAGASGAGLWRTSISGGVTNLQPVNLALQPMIKNGLMVGTNTLAYNSGFPLSFGEALRSWNNTSLGDQNGFDILVGAGTSFNPSLGSYFQTTGAIDRGYAHIQATDQYAVDLVAESFSNRAGIFLTLGGIKKTWFEPSIDDGQVPYSFGTTKTHTTGNLYEVANDATNRFSVNYLGQAGIWGGNSDGAPASNIPGIIWRDDAGSLVGGGLIKDGTGAFGVIENNKEILRSSIHALDVSTNAFIGWSVAPGFYTSDASISLTNVVSGSGNQFTADMAILGVDHIFAPNTTGWDGSGTHFWADDGTFKAAGGGGGGGDTLWATNMSGDLFPSTSLTQSNLFKVAADGSVLSGDSVSNVSPIGLSAPFILVQGIGKTVTLGAASTTSDDLTSAYSHFRANPAVSSFYCDSYAQTASGASYVDLDYTLDPVTPSNTYWEIYSSRDSNVSGVFLQPWALDGNFQFFSGHVTSGNVLEVKNISTSLLTVDYQGLTSTTALSLDNGTTGLPLIAGKSSGVLSFDVATDGNLDTLRGVAYDWPVANAAGNLQNDGSGGLTWVASGGGSSLWTNLSNAFQPIAQYTNFYFGADSFVSATNNGQNVVAIGNRVGYQAIIDSASHDIVLEGYYPARAAVFTGASDISARGQNALATSYLTNVADVHAWGNYPLYGLSATNSSNLYGEGHSAGQGATVTGSGNLFFYGNESGLSSYYTNSFDISAFNGAFKGASFTNSANIIGLLEDAGKNTAFNGSYSLLLIGTNSTAASGAHDQVILGPLMTELLPHIGGNSSAPGIAAGAGAGTSPTVSIAGTDLAGEITITSGTLPSVSAIIATVTFANTYGSAPYAQLTPSNAGASTLGFIPYVTRTTTTLVLNSGTLGLAGATTYKYCYAVAQ